MVWSVDAIDRVRFRFESEIPFHLVRLVHYTRGTPGPGRPLYVLAAEDTLRGPETETFDRAETPLFDFGRAYEIDTPRFGELSARRFGPGAPNKPTIERRHLGEVIRRLPEAEEELRTDVGRFLNGAPELGGENAFRGGGAGPGSPSGPSQAEIFVFNVGQGDTIFIEFPGQSLWLIDAFFDRQAGYQGFINWYRSRYGNRSLDRLVVSHFHYDHIKNGEKVVNDLNPAEVVVPDTLAHPTGTVRNLLDLCNQKGITKKLAQPEQTSWSALEATLIRTRDFPSHPALSNDPNDHALAFVLNNTKSSALLPGDIPGLFLGDLVASSYKPEGRVPYRFYKVTHHCSNTGCEPAFCAIYKPTDAVTSCARKNRYKHPHDPPLTCLNNGRPPKGCGLLGQSHVLTYQSTNNPLGPYLIT